MRRAGLVLALAMATTAAGSATGGVATLPGAGPFAPALARRIDAALRAQGKGYKPRTGHLRPDGSPVYTNRLILDSSPYLLQHAHNPVNWYPWGDEAFETARRLHRPVILSVGYSTCHWCHVMERESFEDAEIARYLNADYVLIKVDREERPDIDGVYMMAVSMMTGGGGWPMTVWLTPDRRPFFGGTYFPPRDGARGARMGFLTIAKRMKAAWDENGGQVVARANQIAEVIRRASAPPPATKIPGKQALLAAEARLAETYDPVNGGFGRAPKFPEPASLDLLLRMWRRTGNARPLREVERTLERMAAGGVHDQIGGGFHRYATDAAWQVPHFEKMLYDQAQLAVVYLEGWQATGRMEFAEVARGILDEMLREMRSPEGGFYAAVDADSPGGEGKYYVWTFDEIGRVLGPARGKFIRAYYGVTPEGNFEGSNILHVASGLDEAAKAAGIPTALAKETLRGSREALRAARAGRPPPATDTKVITAWNGLMISALARAGLALREERYTREAARTADFLLSRMENRGRLKRVWKDGRARVDGTLEDHAFLAAGLLDLFEATSEPRWLAAARRLMLALDAHFADREQGGYFLTAVDAEQLLAREKSDNDGVIPSGNAVAAMSLLRLAEFTSDDAWRRRADATIRGASAILERNPAAAPAMLAAVDFRESRPREIVIAAPARGGAEDLLKVLGKRFVPNRVLVVVTPETALGIVREVPLAEGKTAAGGRPTAYVCERGVCALPTSDPAVFAKQLLKPTGTGIAR